MREREEEVDENSRQSSKIYIHAETDPTPQHLQVVIPDYPEWLDTRAGFPDNNRQEEATIPSNLDIFR